MKRKKTLVILGSIILLLFLLIGGYFFVKNQKLPNGKIKEPNIKDENTPQLVVFDSVYCGDEEDSTLLFENNKYEYYYDQESTCNVVIYYKNEKYSIINAIKEDIVDIEFLEENGISIKRVEKDLDDFTYDFDVEQVQDLIDNILDFDDLIECKNGSTYYNIGDEFDGECTSHVTPKLLDAVGKARLYFNLDKNCIENTVSLNDVNNFLTKYYDTSIDINDSIDFINGYKEIIHEAGSNYFKLYSIDTMTTLLENYNYYNEIIDSYGTDTLLTVEVMRLFKTDTIISDGFYKLKEYNGNDISDDPTFNDTLDVQVTYKYVFDITHDDYTLVTYKIVGPQEPVIMVD